MKIRALHQREPENEGLTRIQRNPDPVLHPFAREREYVRALNAVKTEKIFAKPLVKALDAHFESVRCIRRSNTLPTRFYSAACDGELLLWDLSFSKVQCRWKAHTGFVRGMVESLDGNFLFSCGDDKLIQQWDLRTTSDGTGITAPFNTFRSQSMITSVDHHWQKPLLVTTGETVDLWDRTRSQPINSFEWGCEMVYTARFNPAEPCLLAATAADNSVSLYDLRGKQSAIRKVILKTRSNALCWNPQEPTYFTVANENSNLYTFDMRKLTHAVCVHADHLLAVLDVDYSPNGQSFVSAGYDKCVRLWDKGSQRSRDVYHTKRMQRVLCCQYSTDGRFVFSGSEDHNVRIWKNVSHEKLGVVSDREKKATYYRNVLKERYASTREVSRIKNYHHVPRAILKGAQKGKVMKEAAKKKTDNRRKHSKPGAVPFVSERGKMVVEEKQ